MTTTLRTTTTAASCAAATQRAPVCSGHIPVAWHQARPRLDTPPPNPHLSALASPPCLRTRHVLASQHPDTASPRTCAIVHAPPRCSRTLPRDGARRPCSGARPLSLLLCCAGRDYGCRCCVPPRTQRAATGGVAACCLIPPQPCSTGLVAQVRAPRPLPACHLPRLPRPIAPPTRFFRYCHPRHSHPLASYDVVYLSPPLCRPTPSLPRHRPSWSVWSLRQEPPWSPPASRRRNTCAELSRNVRRNLCHNPRRNLCQHLCRSLLCNLCRSVCRNP